MVQHLTVARVAEALDVAWNTANDAVLAEGQRALIGDPHRYDGVTVIGVDERVWRHTSKGDKYVTVIIDLTAVRAKTGPARLFDMVEGRSKAAFATWLEAHPKAPPKPAPRHGGTGSRWSRWTGSPGSPGSPGSRPLPPNSSRLRSR